MTTRRDWMKGTGVAAVAASLGWQFNAAPVSAEQGGDLESNATGPNPNRRLAVTGPAPWALIAPLSAGSSVGNGYRVDSLSEVREGAATLRLSGGEGQRASVDICLRDGEPVGVAHSRHFDLVLMYEADGAHPTDEALGVVVMSLAARVRTNEERLSRRGFRPHAARDVAAEMDRDAHA